MIRKIQIDLADQDNGSTQADITGFTQLASTIETHHQSSQGSHFQGSNQNEKSCHSQKSGEENFSS